MHGIAEGDPVRLSTPRGEAVLDARLDAGSRPDTVFVPFHWGGAACVNALVSDALDPTSRMPEFKTCPVAVEKAAAPVPAPPEAHTHRTRRHRCTAHPASCRGSSRSRARGCDKPAPLHEALTYTVPMGVTTQPLYFRGGNSTDELVTVVLVRDGEPMRYFPIGAKGDTVHVALRWSRTSLDDTVLELHIAAPARGSRDCRRRSGLVEV